MANGTDAFRKTMTPNAAKAVARLVSAPNRQHAATAVARATQKLKTSSLRLWKNAT